MPPSRFHLAGEDDVQEAAATAWMQAILCRRREQGPIFWAENDLLAVFDARAVQRLEAANFADLTLLDGFVDTVRGRTSEQVTWTSLRSAWSTQMRALTDASGLRQLAGRMDHVLRSEGGQAQDLVWLAERISVEALIPGIIHGLGPTAHRRVVREVQSKIALVLSDVEAHRAPPGHQLRMTIHQLFAGLEVRRELKGRLHGRRPRQHDLADPVVDMVPELGIGRAVDVVTALLTAITGSPGAAAACLLYELSHRHEWRDRIEQELAAVPVESLYASPVRSAPLTTRFLKEILRIWSSPSVVMRRARTNIDLDGVSLKEGQRYVLSPYLIHHDAAYWKDPEIFDPDRWQSDHPRGQCPHGSYVPFGWAPKSCIGANLGMAQLILLAHLLCTRYRVAVAENSQARMIVASVVRPTDFMGAIVPR